MIVSYASYFDGGPEEPYGRECEYFLENEFKKISSKNVKKEIEIVKRKRTNLYRKIHQALLSDLDINELEVEDNVKEHLKTLLELIDAGKIEKSAKSFMRINQLFSKRIRRAVTNLIEEFIDAGKEFENNYQGFGHYKVSWDSLLGELLGNPNDSKIVIDCVVLSAIRGKLVLVTLDRKHMLSKKEVIRNFVEEYCPTVPSFEPDFDLCHVAEITNTP